jgi:asparagine synthase (glutamine-hydrolysing)
VVRLCRGLVDRRPDPGLDLGMCGIAGLVGPKLDGVVPEASGSLCDAILFRGRDEQGEWTDGRNAFLCQARLAIVDVEHGQQPMHSADGRLTLVFAGEIYNHVELRRAYEAEGARFQTRCDTEVVLEGYRLRGPAVCEELNGMFAIAIWDAETRELFLARDRLGKKPLYWWATSRLFAFSSTLDAFTTLPGWRGTVSRASALLYGMVGAFPADRTVYEGAWSLPPASWLSVRPGESVQGPTRYWWPDFRTKATASLAELEEQYEELLVDATRIRLRSDVPTVLSFSGGVDSGSIAWACARRLNTPLRCFTIDHHTEDESSDETLVAKAAARHLGLPWEHIPFDYRRDILADLPDAYAFYDEPCSQLPLVYADHLYRQMKEHATVVLSGNGGDELFTGYIGDEGVRRRDLVASALRPLRPVFRRIARSPSLLRMTAPDGFEQWLRRQARERTQDAETLRSLDDTAARLADDARASGVKTWLDMQMLASMMWGNRDGNFRLADISGLAAQVEVRSPFFDYRMVEFAAALPHRYKVGRLTTAAGSKFLPRRRYAQMMPAEVANAPKRGMGANIRWDRSIAEEPGFEPKFADAYDAVEAAGLDDGTSRRAWHAYRAALGSGADASPYTGAMMTGFMLGAWLRRSSARRTAAAA